MDTFKKTFKYCLYRLALGGICTGACVLLFVILFAIGRALNADEVTAMLMLLWFIVTVALCYVAIVRIGCALRVGHLAAMSEYLLVGELPTDRKNTKASLYAFGMDKLASRFATLGEAQSCERACHSALGELSALFARLPSSSAKTSSLGGTKPEKTPVIFTDIALSYVAQSCLGYVFYNELVNCRKAVAEGIIVYSRFNRKLQKNAFAVALTVIISTVVVFALLFVALLLLLRAFEPTKSLAPFSAFVFAAVIAFVLKFAFTDSLLLASAFTRYISLAPEAEINPDAYGRLCSASAKYRAFYASARKLPDPPPLSEAEADENAPTVTEYDENALRKYTGEIPVVSRDSQGRKSGKNSRTHQNPHVSQTHQSTSTHQSQGTSTHQSHQSTGTQQNRTNNRSSQPSRPSSTDRGIFCPDCGTKNQSSAKYCENCGFKFD